MKTCSLNDFMEELRPWLDSEHLRSAEIDESGHLVVHFMDGMKNVYIIEDCSREQTEKVLMELQKKGIAIS